MAFKALTGVPAVSQPTSPDTSYPISTPPYILFDKRFLALRLILWFQPRGQSNGEENGQGKPSFFSCLGFPPSLDLHGGSEAPPLSPGCPLGNQQRILRLSLATLTYLELAVSA